MPEPAPFSADIEAFELADLTNPPPANAIVCVGSSSFTLWTDIQDDFPGFTIVNRGFGGSELCHSLDYLDRIVMPYQPRQVLLYAGDNDLGGGKSAEQVRDDFVTFTERISAALPETRVDFVSIKPSPMRWHLESEIVRANALIRAYTELDQRRGYIDIHACMLGPDGTPRTELYSDGLHPNRQGYDLWVTAIRPHLLPD